MIKDILVFYRSDSNTAADVYKLAIKIESPVDDLPPGDLDGPSTHSYLIAEISHLLPCLIGFIFRFGACVHRLGRRGNTASFVVEIVFPSQG